MRLKVFLLLLFLLVPLTFRSAHQLFILNPSDFSSLPFFLLCRLTLCMCVFVVRVYVVDGCFFLICSHSFLAA